MPRTVPELLAPAGSLEAVRAALANGANAVYMGAERFHARDDGAQLTMDELAEACRLAHARGARIYLTFNILFKPAELEDALVHLGECIDRGIDAAIVQDIGMVRLIRRVYPELEIHGSTQMTVHDPAGARVLRELGVDRVVLARENTLDDIRVIPDAVPGIGLESFIHGALCISYSGQCYMSGMISERSANRGACAQSCRKDYVLADTATGDELDRGYLISARDLGAWEHLEGIADAGIRCLKIEGRKKKPEYVATVTHAYRTFLDRLAAGAWRPPEPMEIQPLVQIFSRGFTGGMYGGRAGRDYVTRAQPDNRGEPLGQVIGREDGDLIVLVSAPIRAGDGLGFEHPDGPTHGNTGFTVTRVRDLGRTAGRYRQAIQPAARVPAGWTVVRSSTAELLTRARASWQARDEAAARVAHGGGTNGARGDAAATIDLDITVSGRAGTALTCVFAAAETSVRVESGIALQRAEKHGLDRARLEAQLGRLGGTVYRLGRLDADALEGGLFLPVSALNEMRQQATMLLDAARAEEAGRRAAERRVRIRAAIADVDVSRPAPGAVASNGSDSPFRLVAEVWRPEDARVAAEAGATEISFDPFLRHPTPTPMRVRALTQELAAAGVPLRLRTPTIVRPEERAKLERWLALDNGFVSGHLGLVAELAAAGRDVVADYAVNCFNAHTAAAIFGLGARRIVLSIELTLRELEETARPWGGRPFEVVVHGRPEGMTIEHCVLSAAFDRGPRTCRDLCVKKHPDVTLTDPAGYTFPVATDAACRNRLLHSRPIDGSQFLAALWRAGLRTYRLLFNVPGDPVAAITAGYRRMLEALAAGESPDPAMVRSVTGDAFTRGHFVRAV